MDILMNHMAGPCREATKGGAAEALGAGFFLILFKIFPKSLRRVLPYRSSPTVVP